MEHRQRSSGNPEAAVRTRWTPKPEQILILESIFNGGMVNPRKEETVKIRNLLEQFGAVGDANIFYWFQNRRSRARRSQRQMQAAGVGQPVSPLANSRGVSAAAAQPPAGSSGVNILRTETASSPITTTSSNNSYHGGGGGLIFPSAAAGYCTYNNSSCSNVTAMDDSADDLFSITRQMGLTESAHYANTTPFTCSSDHLSAQLHHQSAGSSSFTVFIDGVQSEVPRGHIDLRLEFGQNAMLLHSSGELLPVDEHGILMQSLKMGESYFLVRMLN